MDAENIPIYIFDTFDVLNLRKVSSVSYVTSNADIDRIHLVIPDDVTCYDLGEGYSLQPLKQRMDNLTEAVFAPSIVVGRHNINTVMDANAIFVLMHSASKVFKENVEKRLLDNKKEFRRVDAFKTDNTSFLRWLAKRR